MTDKPIYDVRVMTTEEKMRALMADPMEYMQQAHYYRRIEAEKFVHEKVAETNKRKKRK